MKLLKIIHQGPLNDRLSPHQSSLPPPPIQVVYHNPLSHQPPCTQTPHPTHARPSLLINQNPNLTPPNTYPSATHYTAAQYLGICGVIHPKNWEQEKIANTDWQHACEFYFWCKFSCNWFLLLWEVTPWENINTSLVDWEKCMNANPVFQVYWCFKLPWV